MSSHEELEQRSAAVEAELPVVRQEVAAARALAAGADRDVAEYRAELRGHTRMLAALRETQLEHYAEHKTDVAELKTEMAELRSGLSHVRVGVEHIVRLLEDSADDAGRGGVSIELNRAPAGLAKGASDWARHMAWREVAASRHRGSAPPFRRSCFDGC